MSLCIVDSECQMSASSWHKITPQGGIFPMSGHQISRNWQVVEIYENGKGRRYKLLFAVNGGAYVLIGFLVDKGDALKLSPVGVWAFVLIPLALAFYTLLMYWDIDAFGKRMKRIDDDLYQKQGQRHLLYVCMLLMVAWVLAIAAIIFQWSHAF
jgi:hypothetical protein